MCLLCRLTRQAHAGKRQSDKVAPMGAYLCTQLSLTISVGEGVTVGSILTLM